MINISDLRFRRLTEDTNLDDFVCADDDLNDFLWNEAKDYQKELLAVTYLLYYDNSIIAYFSLLNDTVKFQEDDKKVRNKINRKIPYPKQRTHYPAVKVGRLAVDSRYAHNVIGEIIIDCICSMLTTNNKTGCRFLTVDAYSDVTDFYEKKGEFRFFSENDKDDETRLMYYDLKNFK